MQVVGMKNCIVYNLLENYFTQESGDIWESGGEIVHKAKLMLILVPELAHSQLTGCICMTLDSVLFLTCCVLWASWTPSCWWRLIQGQHVSLSCMKSFCLTLQVAFILYLLVNVKKIEDGRTYSKQNPKKKRASLPSLCGSIHTSCWRAEQFNQQPLLCVVLCAPMAKARKQRADKYHRLAFLPWQR